MSQATLVAGANSRQFDLPQSPITVRDFINRFKTMMNIADGPSSVMLNGRAAADSDPVQAGDEVEVVKQAGEKG